MIDYYKLDGHRVVPAADVYEWGRMLMEDIEARRVAETNLPGDVQVSTVFFGLDHRFGAPGPPLVFETMVFGGEHDQYMERCSTWDEAEQMHARAVAQAKGEA